MFEVRKNPDVIALAVIVIALGAGWTRPPAPEALPMSVQPLVLFQDFDPPDFNFDFDLPFCMR